MLKSFVLICLKIPSSVKSKLLRYGFQSTSTLLFTNPPVICFTKKLSAFIVYSTLKSFFLCTNIVFSGNLAKFSNSKLYVSKNISSSIALKTKSLLSGIVYVDVILAIFSSQLSFVENVQNILLLSITLFSSLCYVNK